MPPMTPANPQLLIADDEGDVLRALQILLRGAGYEVTGVGSAEAALANITKQRFSAFLMDLNFTRGRTEGHEGLELLARVRAVEPNLPIVVMTAWGSVDLAVQAMRAGAHDFVLKPWDNERLLATVKTQVQLGQALRDNERLNELQTRIQDDRRGELVGRSAAIERLRDLVARVGPTDVPVMITGENGTGKGVLARVLHAASGRSSRPLVTVNAAALSEGVADSELFGHVRGAFTGAHCDRMGRFETADGATLFLDEIADISPALQAKLLRVIETGEFERLGSSKTLRAHVRIIAATNADLRARVADGRFREDLLFRLNVVPIEVPPLRSRGEDLRVLAEHFLAKHAQRYRKPHMELTDDAHAALRKHRWPGNVRELSHAIERAVLLARTNRIAAADLAFEATGVTQEPEFEALPVMHLEEAERQLINRALEQAGGQVEKAALLLGLSRSGLYRRLEKYGLRPSGT